MTLDLSKLKDHKAEILKCEIISLLFNLGKTHAGISNYKKEKNKKKDYFPQAQSKFTGYRKYYNDHFFESELKEVNPKLLDFVDSITINIFNQKITWIKSSKKNVTFENFFGNIFFSGCENINSSIDKGAPISQLDKLWISNAFGGYKEDVKQENLDCGRKLFFQKLDSFLEYKGFYANKNNIKESNWCDLRNFVFDNVKDWYIHLLSDTRFPVNDVTLWDQAYMSASLFKAFVSSAILKDNCKEGSKSNEKIIDSKRENYRNIKWSILGIQYDKLALAEKALKPVHIKWYREVAKEVDDEISDLFVCEYPIGNEIYRDETGIYFLVSEELINGNSSGDNSSNFYPLSDDLDEIKKAVREVFLNKFHGEVFPAIFLTKPSRRLGTLGHLLYKASENYLKAELPPNFEKEMIKDSDSQGEGVCQVCVLRLANKKDKDYLVCDICEERGQGRLDEWMNNRSQETIWTGEIQDKNGMIALVTLKFELEQWLNGNFLSTMVINDIYHMKNVPDFSSLIEELIKDIETKPDKPLKETSISELVDKGIINNKKKITLLNEYIESILFELTIGTQWENFIKETLKEPNRCSFDENNRKIDWNGMPDEDKRFLLTLFTQFIIQKGPSPARLKRIWDSTQDFLIGIKSKLVRLLEIPENRKKRFIWKEKGIPDGEYYDGDLDFWVKDGNVYLITNTEKIGRKNKFNLRNYQAKGKVSIELNLNAKQEEDYLPFISIIDPTPVSWQFAIPANYVQNLLKNIKEEYLKSFGWVYGKLPLHIGIIIQNYKKPLYVGIKALRKIRRDKTEWKDLRQETGENDLKSILKDTYQNNYSVSDNLEDYYSLYEKTNNDGKYKFYIYPDVSKESSYSIIDTLKDDVANKYYFYPNTFDFEFLETNSRRNDIFYELGKRRINRKNNRPYNLEDFQYFILYKNFFENKESSKLQKLVYLIYSKIADWEGNEESIKSFLLSTFVNILELKNEEEKRNFALILKCNDWEELERTDVNLFIDRVKTFLDMFEFYHKALKGGNLNE